MLEPKADGIISLVLTLLLIVSWVVGGVFLIIRSKDSYVLKLRIPWLIIGQGIGMCWGCLTVSLMVFFQFRVSCFLFSVMQVAAFSMFFICTLLRTFVIWFRFNLTHEVVKIAESDLSKTQALSKDKKWNVFSRNRHIIQSGQLLVAFASIFAFVVVPVIIILAVQFDKTSGLFVEEECRLAARNVLVLIALFCVSGFIIMGDLFRRMWSRVESLGIFKEYRIAFAAFAFFICAAIIRLAAPNAWNFGYEDSEFYGFYIFAFIVPGYVFLGAFLLFPLYLSYTREVKESIGQINSPREDDENAPKAPKDFFLQTLVSADGFEAFKKFLMAEWSVENLYFYKKAVKYRNDFLEYEESSKKEAWKLYIQCFPHNSNLCINISSRTRENVMVHMEQWRDFFEKGETMDPEKMQKHPITKTIFDVSAKEVFALMLDDSFRRFRLTPEYLSLKDSLNETWKAMGPRRKGSLTIAYVARAPTFETEESVIAVVV